MFSAGRTSNFVQRGSQQSRQLPSKQSARDRERCDIPDVKIQEMQKEEPAKRFATHQALVLLSPSYGGDDVLQPETSLKSERLQGTRRCRGGNYAFLRRQDKRARFSQYSWICCFRWKTVESWVSNRLITSSTFPSTFARAD